MMQHSHLTAWQAYDREEAEQLLRERIRDASFRRDMNTLLRADYGPYDINAAAALVLDTYLVHLE
jgi:hypothetical protein